jgi:hypothetical protein
VADVLYDAAGRAYRAEDWCNPSWILVALLASLRELDRWAPLLHVRKFGRQAQHTRYIRRWQGTVYSALREQETDAFATVRRCIPLWERGEQDVEVQRLLVAYALRGGR